MSERSITDRVRVLGEQVGLEGLCAHDCRHYWATYWADKVDVLRLQEAGGWSVSAMPRRYVKRARSPTRAWRRPQGHLSLRSASAGAPKTDFGRPALGWSPCGKAGGITE